jgi:hypothetical protein
MIVRWETIGDDDLVVGDKEAVASIYEVSIRTVERHCEPLYRAPKEGLPRGESGVAIYDLLAAAAVLEGVAPRSRAAGQTLRHRMERHYLT